MASRRSRIKGIANIPQRRKANALEEDTVSEGSTSIQDKVCESTESRSEDVLYKGQHESKPDEAELIATKESNVTSQEGIHRLACREEQNGEQKDDPEPIIQHTVVPDDEPTPESNCDTHVFVMPKPSTPTYTQNKLPNDNVISNTINSEIPEINVGELDSNDPNEIVASNEKTFVAPPKSAQTSCELNNKTQHNEHHIEYIKKTESENPKVEGEKQIASTKLVVKSGNRLHRFIKPRPTIISRQTKISTETQESSLNEISVTSKCDLNTTEIGNSQDELRSAKENISVPPKELKYTLCEIQLTPQCGNLISEDEKTEQSAKKLSLNIISASNSEVEYPLPPASPNKINRSRIKAIPKFDHRRTSFSASESEDESRRHRHRNDSVSSSVSGVQEALTDCIMSPQRTKEFSSAFQKKCRRTEQSRKLAEARREFHLKFGKDTPNRSKLTMMDLIFYNPKTNPMQGSKTKTKTTSITESGDPTDNPDDPATSADDPKAQSEDHSDEENDMPAPQIKIGPSGELIIDEKSLVFESKKTKKDREELQQSAVINVDHDGSYGIYKKGKRTKDWDQMETIRFYKALNTIGTDFSLMCELFPNRSRRELKVKFNKEERINRGLVDRAITQPTQFDFTLLQQEAVFEEEERKVQQENKKLAEEARKKSREESREGLQNKVFKRVTREDKLRGLIDLESTKPKRKPSPIRIESKREKDPKRRKRKPKKKIKNYLRIGGVVDDDSENDILNGSSSDNSEARSENHREESGDEIVVDERPTRYGRIPRKRKTYEPTFSKSYIKETRTKKKRKKEVLEEKYEPGSIMLVTTVGPNGEPVYNVLMVTADQNAQPIELNPSIVETLKQAVTQEDICSKDIGMPDELRSLKTQNILKITARPYIEESTEENVTIPSEETCDAPASETSDGNYTIEENVTIPAVPTEDVQIESHV